MNWLKHLQTPTLMRPFVFDRVTVSGRPLDSTASGELFSIVGRCYSEYESGPSLHHLAEVAGQMIGAGFYGLASCRELGWRAGNGGDA